MFLSHDEQTDLSLDESLLDSSSRRDFGLRMVKALAKDKQHNMVRIAMAMNRFILWVFVVFLFSGGSISVAT